MARYFVTFTVLGELEIEASTESEAQELLLNSDTTSTEKLFEALDASIDMRGDDAISILYVELDEEND